MPYCGQDKLVEYFNFSTSTDAPAKVVTCAFTQGGGIPMTVLSLFFFGGAGLALAYRNRHPAPILVAFMLTGGVAAATSPGEGINILAVVFFVGISGVGLYLYSKASQTL